jgi:hypothetical protein
MLTTFQLAIVKIRKNFVVILFFIFLFSFKVFELENTFGWYAWGGLAVKMNPYNLHSINVPKKIMVTINDIKKSEIQFNQFKYDLLFPLSVKGSFKYFHYRFPDIEEQTSLKLCYFVKKEYGLEPREVQVYSINKSLKTIHKRYFCR